MAKPSASPSAQFLPHEPRITGPDVWDVHFIHGVTSVLGGDRMLDMLSKGWEPFALSEGILALRRRRVA